ncbi:DUF418 domain-containing protein [Bacillus sp. FJAT-49705]|uniref:DUF418 domain-containing protein n=1 Tax=Cytobacillus citreus TaxID=2833586 RepID=A0ABS5NPH4_9BACI|nr:DUF418 domain-containing protein [Cytobacillus citreus]MBS4189716.1 DUF418 domain-containing protein [Cytobacillus citreus]
MKTQNKRIQVIDAIRGFSLLGILIANMLIFQYGIFGKDEMDFYSISAFDKGVHTLLKIAVEGSFMPIFAFLFGYSLIKMKEGLDAKGLKPKRNLARRYILLIILGALHSTFLWEGDILLSYGLMGFFLLMFMNRKKKTLVIWGIILLILTSFMGLGMNEPVPMEDETRMAEYVKDTYAVYGSGTYEEIKYHRSNVDPLGLPDYVYLIMFIIMPFITAPLFLFGMFAAKNQEFHDVKNKSKFYFKYGMIITVIGLLMKGGVYLFPDLGWLGMLNMLGANILSLGYICLFASIYSLMHNSLLFKAFESVGKLSLSNYLLQTVICTTIFYGYGFGLFGKLGVFYGLLLSLFIYGCQLFISYWYLKMFKTGPVEKLMRICTYLTLSGRPKVKKQSEETYVKIV